ncbi:non-ribosomal peptide synthetase [Chromobacterium sp. ATCC 53434]|uniref:hybrid non-ribosomal peptide synthetase/type I polyketide synthase n=1 Tax=Chromobacterium sp. (strain ATCC 53434 / SC 14030) TaxID=2059672 RepID=UPI000C774A82|nr:hybrid non-ribosomal peptide synthetase/type I polyketide synthase [Chromobacterium sp. ATCC 53434]AUH53484.1 non-ribosomal peptide synthetase [Chromobacterium sp. ATCC 53434]
MHLESLAAASGHSSFAGLAGLSAAQQSLWFLNQFERGGVTYNVPFTLRLSGRVDADALARAFAVVQRRHPALRSRFPSLDGKPAARIVDTLAGLERADLSADPDPEMRIALLEDEQARSAFDLERDAPILATLARIADDEYALIVTVHHIVFDGRSVQIFLDELANAYEALAGGVDPDASSLADGLHPGAAVGGAELEAGIEHWRSRLVGAPAVLPLPLDHPRPAERRFNGRRAVFDVPADVVRALRGVASGRSVSMYMIGLAAFAVLLRRYTHEGDVVIGSPISNRYELDCEDAIGYFVNTLPNRIDASGSPTFAQLLDRVRETVLETLEHSYVPFEKIVEAVQPPRSLSHGPVFQVLFDLAAEGFSTAFGDGIAARFYTLDSRTAKYDLSLTLSLVGDGMRGAFEYDCDLLDDALVERMSDSLVRILRRFAADLNAPIDGFPLLSREAAAVMLSLANDGARDPDAPFLPFHRAVEEVAARDGDAIALVYGEARQTYADVDARATALAGRLRASGVRRGDRVVVLRRYGPEVIIALLAIHKIGAVFVLVSPDDARHASLLDDVAPAAVVVAKAGDGAGFDGPVIAMDEADGAERAPFAADGWEDEATLPDDIAYVIFTSGSTGRPKGVQVSHGSWMSLFHAFEAAYGRAELGVTAVLQMANHTFDVFMSDVIRGLGGGGRLIMCPRESLSDAAALHGLIEREGATVMEFVPAVVRQMIDYLERSGKRLRARAVTCGADVWFVHEYRKLRALCAPDTRVLSVYGVTEATCESATFEPQVSWYESERSLPIGAPLPNTSMYVVDGALNLVPLGVPGELLIGGGAVASGYLNRPELNQERFPTGSFDADGRFASDPNGRRFYRTGDLCRHLADGTIEFIGRLDNQVKVRGFRIELGEIESVLADYSAVRECAVVTRPAPGGELELVAYASAAETADILLAHLRARLPAHMVPRALVLLPALPLSANGKIDRKRLPDPDWNATERVYTAPRNPLEARIAEDWEALLQTTRVGVHDNFFERGGHSLLITQTLARVHDAFGVKLRVADLFERPTIAQLAETVMQKMMERAQGGGAERASAAISEASGTERRRLSFAQRRMWFAQQAAPTSAYNMPEVFRARGPLDRAALEAALNHVIARHETLRTRFGAEVQTFVDDAGATRKEPLAQVDEPARLALVAESVDAANLDQRLAREAAGPFALDREWPIRASLWRMADDDHVLCVVLHHIAYDGWSSALLRRELAAAYREYAGGGAPGACALKPQYQDYAAWQRAQAATPGFAEWVAAWRERLSDLPPALPLHERAGATDADDAAGDYAGFELPAACSAQLTRLCERLSCTPTMVLHAAFAVLLHRYTGQDDIIIGIPFAGRDHPDAEALLGFFVNLLPVRLRMEEPMRLADAVKASRRALLDADAGQAVPLDHLVETLNPARAPGRHPFFQIGLVVQSAPPAALNLPGLAVEEIALASDEVKLDLMLEIRAFDGAPLGGGFKYRKSRYARGFVDGLARHFGELLRNLLADAEQTVSEVRMLPADEYLALTRACNQTRRDFGAGGDVVAQFESRVLAAPDAVALAFDARRWTYAQLDALSNRIAAALLERGAAPGARVGLFTGRHPYLVAGMLGALKARCAFVPLNPDDKIDGGLGYTIADAGVRFLIAQRDIAPRCAALGLATLVADDIDDERSPVPRLPGIVREPTDLAYVLYTSGSTGRPKGVMVTQRNLRNTANAFAECIGLYPGARQLQYFSPVFDGVCGEVFPVLISGATLVFAHGARLLPGPELLELLRAAQITHLQITPTALRLLPHAELPDLATIVAAGEACPANVAHAWAQGRRFINGYGPTETTIYASATDYWDARGSLVLNPIANVMFYVLDRYRNPLPHGVPGELYIGGEGVAAGYLNLDEATARSFVPDPFSSEPGARCYRTGDYVIRQADGSLVYVGRSDGQVKIRGFRVEAGEIEAHLNALPGIEQGIVAAPLDANGHRILIGYYVGTLEEGDAQAQLARKLPAHMVPERLVKLPELPRARTGKVDRKALAAYSDAQPTQAAPAPAVSSPATTGERVQLGGRKLLARVRRIWQEVLERDDIEADGNFFDLGGHSLRIVEMRKRLEDAFSTRITIPELFEHPTLRALVAHLERLRVSIADDAAPQPAAEAADVVVAGDGEAPAIADGAIAVIGMAGRFAGAPDLQAFWDTLIDGAESTLRFSEELLAEHGADEAARSQPDFVKLGNRLEDADKFDAEFFGYSAREAALMDPQQRLFLECAWAAAEAAGYGSARGARVGVFASAGTSHYLLDNVYPRRRELKLENIQWLLGNGRDFLATRVAYKLDLAGPAVTVETACSSSLVAVHAACASLRSGDCEMALVGGVSLEAEYYGYRPMQGSIISADGYCRPFDADASGTTGGSGCAVVMLKPLAKAIEDGDHVHAVILGSAINNDGAGKVSYTAPSVAGQADVIAAALRNAQVPAETIGYVEAHGTGTRLGDPIEFRALAQAYAADGRWPDGSCCALGSVKANFGHLDAAAGITGFVKAVLAVERGELPPMANFTRPNAEIDLDGSPFYVNTDRRAWPEAPWPRRAGISSFGIGGTNAHVIIEAPPRQPSPLAEDDAWRVLPLSAKSPSALRRMRRRLAAHLRATQARLSDVAYSLGAGRARLPFRDTIVCATREQALVALEAASETPAREPREDRPLVFMFPGQGAQHVGMLRGLYEREPVFREALDECAALLRAQSGPDILAFLYPAPEREDEAAAALRETEVAQPALFAVEYACAQLLISRGAQADALIGHSLGELVAACIGGCYALPDALAIVAMRGRLMQRAERGAMLAVTLSEQACANWLGSDVELAAVNGRAQCVLAGGVETMARLQQALTDAGVQSQPIRTSHAFHSRRMADAARQLEAFVATIPVQAGAVPIVSNRTGDWLSLDADKHAAYWASHLRDTVRFADGIEMLHEAFDTPILLEVGPGRTLRAALDADAGEYETAGCGRHPRDRSDDAAMFEHAVAALWRMGARLDWPRVRGADSARRVPLPTYPFARARHWIDAPIERGAAPALYRHWRRLAGGGREYALALLPSLWLVDEHRVFDGKPVLPGTGCLELVRGAFERMGHGPMIEMRDVYFPAPLVLDEARGPHAVRVTFGGEDGAAQDFALTSAPLDDDGAWIIHAQGRIAAEDHASTPSAAFDHLRDLRADTLASVDARTALNERLALFGPRWRCFRSMWLAEDEGVARLELDPGFAADLGRFPLHPALLDMATGFLAVMENRGARLPFHYGRLSIHAPLTERLYSHARRVRENVYDLTLFAADAAGGVGPALASVEGFTLRDERLDAAAADRSAPDAWCTRPAWRPALPPRGEALPATGWTIVARQAAWREAIQPFAPRDSAWVDGEHEIAPGDADGYAGLVERQPEPAQWVYCADDGDSRSAGALFDDLMRLLQAFAPKAPHGTVLTLVSSGACAVRADDRPRPAQAALAGALRAAAWEFPQLRCRHIDLPAQPGAADYAALGDALARADVGERTPLAPTVAVRDGTFHEPFFRALPALEAPPRLVDGGVYVITGGLGGMGLAFAAHIAKHAAAPRLHLVSRSAGATKPEVEASLSALRELGTEVTLVQADCGDHAAFAAALADIRARHGRIDGAIHAAGAEASGPIQLGAPALWERVLAPKTTGVEALLDALRGEQPDFVLLCSSLASLVGGVGQADYAAANAYLDAAAHAARRDGLPVVAVNWDAWAEVGMRVEHDRAHPGQTPIDAAHGLLVAEGCRVFDITLAQQGAQVAVNKAADIDAWMRRLAGGPGARREREGASAPAEHAERLAPRTDIERQLAELWRELLGGELPGVRDDFFTLGGHSLLGAQLISRVRERFPQCLTLAEFLDEPTIERIAQSLGATEGAEDAGDAVDAHVRYCLVPVQRAGAGAPFFVLPGMGGNVNQLLPLAKAMGGDRPFYGLQCLGLDGKAEPHGSVEEMAEHYVRCIRSVQPHGPYLLGGHSLGGKVALEMARLLDADGEPPGLIALFDSAAPPYLRMAAPTDAQVVGSLLSIFGRYSGKPVEVTRAILERLEAASHEERLGFLKTQLQTHGLIDARADEGSIRGIFNVYRAAGAFGMSYDPPKQKLPWSFVLFRAVDSMPAGINLPEIRQTPAWGWEAFSASQVDYIDVPGDHFTCLADAHVEAIAQPLRQRLGDFGL